MRQLTAKKEWSTHSMSLGGQLIPDMDSVCCASGMGSSRNSENAFRLPLTVIFVRYCFKTSFDAMNYIFYETYIFADLFMEFQNRLLPLNLGQIEWNY